MILPVRLYSEPILNTVCKPVTDFEDPMLQQLISDMIETCSAYSGVGLAASQIGIDKQIAVLNVENRTKIITIINPVILRYSKETDKQVEGCLSVPGFSAKIKRYKGVEVKVQNLLGEKIQYRFTDYDARIFAHEWDHLNGVTIAHKALKKQAGML